MRQSQIERLIAAVDAFAGTIPIVIGGDLNANGAPGPGDAPREPLFAAAERHGFDWSNNAKGVTTRRSPLSGTIRTRQQLDWFFSRGFKGKGAEIRPALDDSGKVLSDHELIVGRFAHP